MGLIDFIFRKRGTGMDMSEPYMGSADAVFYDQKTRLAYQMYQGDKLGSNKLSLPKSIVDTIVTSSIQEFDFKVSTDNKLMKSIEKQIKNNLRILNSHLCVGGSVALKPYIKLNKVGVAVYGAQDFRAEFNEFGEVTKVYFKTSIKESKYDTFILVEEHSYDENSRVYRIDNRLYKTMGATKEIDRLGEQVPLSSCEATQYLEDFYIVEDVDRHLCSIITLDNSLTPYRGVSIYDSSISLIEDAETIYKSLLWEYEGGELAIDANASLFEVSGSSIHSHKYIMPDGKDRLYRKLPGADNDFSIEVFAPTLRDANYRNGLDDILRKIELNCGLYYGALSNTETSERTATEVISSKQRFYSTITTIRNKDKEGIEDIIHSCGLLSNRLMPSFMHENVTVEFNIGDSVLEAILPNGSNKEEASTK